MKCSLRHMIGFLGLLSLVFVLSTGCKEDNDVKQFMEVGKALAKNINQLSKEPGITLTGFASNPDKKLFKVGIGIDHTKITNECLKLVVKSYLNNTASFTSQHDPKKMLEPYNLQIEEIDKDKNTTSLIAEKPSGSTEISWKEDNNTPLPTSAKQTAENQITIPFPSTDQFPNGIEQWVIDRDRSNHFVLKALFKSKEVAVFPANAIGVNQVSAKITLGGKEYSVTSIALNNDQTSGQITLISASTHPDNNPVLMPMGPDPKQKVERIPPEVGWGIGWLFNGPYNVSELWIVGDKPYYEQNAWNPAYAYSGSLKDNPKQGFIGTFVMNGASDHSWSGNWNTPQLWGAVKITDVTRDIVDFVTDSGIVGTFNLDNHEWKTNS